VGDCATMRRWCQAAFATYALQASAGQGGTERTRGGPCRRGRLRGPPREPGATGPIALRESGTERDDPANGEVTGHEEDDQAAPSRAG
jgi:hypothetical protein